LSVTELEQIQVRIAAVITELGDGSTLSGPDAERLLAVLVRIERAVGAGRMVAQLRAVEGGAWRRAGAPSPAAWVAQVTGETPVEAAQSLASSEEVVKLEDTTSKLVSGEVSLTQAALVAHAASLDPAAERRLLSTAQAAGTGALSRSARAVRHAARGPTAVDRQRVHATRHLRTWTTDDGAFEGRFRLCTDQGAVLAAALSSWRQRIFERARREGKCEHDEAYEADALVELARNADPGGRSAEPSALLGYDFGNQRLN